MDEQANQCSGCSYFDKCDRIGYAGNFKTQFCSSKRKKQKVKEADCPLTKDDGKDNPTDKE